MYLLGLLKFLIGFSGLIIAFVFLMLDWMRKRKPLAKRPLQVFGVTILIVVAVHTTQYFLYPPNPRSEQLVLAAYREAQVGGIWLGLYEDGTWEMGNSDREVRYSGSYTQSSNTILLSRNSDEGKFSKLEFEIQNKRLVESTNTGIGWLEIDENGLQP